MKHYMKVIFSLVALSLFAAATVQAETTEKMLIALKTDNFELAETDISALGIGESQTIETASGKIIDILRTADGVELYIDGELLEMDFDGEGIHEAHMMSKHVKVHCDSDDECGKHVFVVAGDDHDMSAWLTDEGDYAMLHDVIEHSCSLDDDESGCGENYVWISEEEDFDLAELHEMHASGSEHKIIIIKKKVIVED